MENLITWGAALILVIVGWLAIQYIRYSVRRSRFYRACDELCKTRTATGREAWLMKALLSDPVWLRKEGRLLATHTPSEIAFLLLATAQELIEKDRVWWENYYTKHGTPTRSYPNGRK